MASGWGCNLNQNTAINKSKRQLLRGEYLMFGFLIAVCAGYLVVVVEKPVGQPVAAFLGRFIPVESGELRIVSFATMLVAAAFLSSFFGSGTMIGQAVGLCLGYFGARIVSAGRKAWDDRSE